VFEYEPRRGILTIIFNSAGAGITSLECNNPDNIAVSNRGGIILCEDGGNSIQRMRGLSQNGRTFIFAENRMNLTAADVAQAHEAVNRGRGGVVAHVTPGNIHRHRVGWCVLHRQMDVRQPPDAGHHLRDHWAVGQQLAVVRE
jgi:uncharacterized protein